MLFFDANLNCWQKTWHIEEENAAKKLTFFVSYSLLTVVFHGALIICHYYSRITNLQAYLCLYESLLLIKLYWQILPRFIQFFCNESIDLACTISFLMSSKFWSFGIRKKLPAVLSLYLWVLSIPAGSPVFY